VSILHQAAGQINLLYFQNELKKVAGVRLPCLIPVNMKTATKQTDKKIDYLYKQLIPAILKADKRIELDNKGGSLVLPLAADKGIVVNGSVWFLAYVTPFWEGSIGIPIDVGNDDGSYAEGETVPYRLTYNVATDVKVYLDKVNQWIQKHTP
jgi:hypothetical protein